MMMSKKEQPLEETADQIELNRRLDEMVTAGRRKMSQIRVMARDAVRYIYGDQHRGRPRKKGWEYPVINRVYADMLQEVAMLSSNKPRITAIPAEDTDIETATVCAEVLKAQWTKELKMPIKVIQGIMDDHISGIKIAKCYWEPKYQWDDEQAEATGKGWRGKIEVNVISPDNFGCDENVELAAEIPTKARYVFTERWVDKKWAAQRWPAYREYLIEKGEYDKQTGQTAIDSGPNTDDESGFSQSSYEWRGVERSKGDSPTSDAILQGRLANFILGGTGDANVGVAAQAGPDMVKLLEIYFQDYEMEEVPARMEKWPPGEGQAAHIQRVNGSSRYYDTTQPIVDENNQPTGQYEIASETDWPERQARPAYIKPKYPKGRMVVRIDEKFIAEDVAWTYDRWPFCVSPGYLLPHTWQGHNCVELSRGMQDWMNIIGSHLTNYVKFFGDPQIWVEREALAQYDKNKKKRPTFPNWAGAVVEFAKGAINRGAAKINQPPSLPATFFNIFGLFKEADQDLKGVHDVAQGRASSGKHTLGELEMLNRNTRQRIALQGVLLDEWLRQIAEWVVDLMQENFQAGQWVRYVGEDPEAKAATVQWTEKMADANYDIILEPISTLPYDEERELLKYIEAYKLAGPAMLETILKKMKIPNSKEILTKHEIIGPLTQLMELAQQNGMGPEELMAAMEQQLQTLGQMAGRAA
jgi:hypothetical protein